jgi:uncharacterized protein (DUF952 family)
VAEFVYGDADDLVVLVIDSDRLIAPVRYEAPEPGGERYPHIYGPLPTEAVTAIRPHQPDPGPNPRRTIKLWPEGE